MTKTNKCKFCKLEHNERVVCSGKKKVLFVYSISNPTNWRDGLWAAMKLLEKDFDITRWNLALEPKFGAGLEHFDFILGWSSFEGEIAYLMRSLEIPSGLLIGGYTFQPSRLNRYDVLFYETNWYGDAELKHRHSNTLHAFGINTDIFQPLRTTKIFDYLTVGAFAEWKRQLKILDKPGTKLAVGQIQFDNMSQSLDIVSNLLAYGCGVMGEVAPEALCQIINASRKVYLPANLGGGGERAVLEARSCGVPVEIEKDNPKLEELLTSPIYSHFYYAEQIKKGIESCLN